MNSLNDLFGLLEQSARENYIGENISQLEHAMQCAMQAEKEGYDAAVVLGALFHDIGHLLEGEEMGGYGIRHHDRVGADCVRALGFPEITAALIENHVEAKRYLCWKNKAYFRSLSAASLATLEYQGGLMSNDEAERFESLDHFSLFIRMRRWDELAKMENVQMPDLSKYIEMSLALLEGSEPFKGSEP